MSVKVKNKKGEWVEVPSIKGGDGFSPVVEVIESENGHIVEITDANGTKTFEVLNGQDGQDGQDGEDGISPTVEVTETENGHQVKITDATGEHTFEVKDGRGGNGEGEDGFSPTVSVTEIENGHKVEITDVNGTKSFDVKDGYTPQKNADYFDGVDGISPTVEVTETENGHIVKITDATGEHIFEVLNGKDGTGGGEVSIDEIDAEKVFFSDNLLTTQPIGNISLTNGQATIEAKGKNLKQVWNTIFVKEKNPSRTNPSVSLTFDQAKPYEVGTKITPTYSATFKVGSYTYGPATGVKVNSWEVTDTEGNTKNTASGSFPEIQVTDEISYKITAKANHTEGAVPVTNVGNEYPSGKIVAGSKSKTSDAITGYRKSFYGTVDKKDTVTASIIRSLNSSDTAHAEGDSFVVEVPVGALRVIIAYPSALRDITSIKDVNASRSEISSSFKLQKIDVPGANGYKPKSYKVYTMDFAEPYDTANTFEVTI